MKKSIWSGVCTAIVGFAAAAMAAQTPASSQSANQPSNDHRVTVTGCLAAAPSSGADTPTGTTGAGSTATAGTTGTAGTAGATAARRAGVRYNAAVCVDERDDVGRRVSA